MMRKNPPRVIGWLAALLAVVFLLVLIRVPIPGSDGATQVALALLAILCVARVGGIYPGLFVTGFTAFLSSQMRSPSTPPFLRTATIMMAGVIISAVLESLRRSRGHVEDSTAALMGYGDALQLSETRLRAILDHAPVSITLEDSEGRYTLANSAFAALHGLSREEIQGKTRVDLKLEPVGGWLETDVSTVRVVSGAIECEKIHHGPDGERTLLSLSFSVPRGPGALPELCTLQTDITARRIAERSLKLLAEAGEVLGCSLDDQVTMTGMAQLLVNSLADLCLIDVFDENDRLQRVVKATSHPELEPILTRLSQHYVPNGSDNELASRVLREGVSLNRSEPGLGLPTLWVVPLKARRRIVGLIWLGSMHSEQENKGLWTFGLIEELARRTAIAVDNARLYQEAREALRHRDQAVIELRSALDTAEEAARIKNQFLAALSHELRTPLTPVLVSLSALITDPETPEEIKSILEVTLRNASLEARLIDDLLDVTRITQGKLQLNLMALDAHELIHQAIAICRDDISAAGLQFDVKCAATSSFLMVDSTRFQQIVWNLLKNATKFTPRNGKISLRSFNAADQLIIEIEDTGIGMEANRLKIIFDAFEQGHAQVTRQFGGLGLGLAISRSLAEALGGTLGASSAGVGQGSTFRLTLPTVLATTEPLGSAEAMGLHSNQNRGLRILLVEDNDDTRQVMCRLLARKGHAVTAAGTMSAALEAIQVETFDIMVSDISLPDGDGLELMRRIAVDQPRFKAIALSGFGMDSDVQESVKAGFLAHLIKPIDFVKLESTIRSIAFLTQ